MSRDEARAAFLQSQGIAPEAARPLAGDASNRRYLRIAVSEQILMDAPPDRGEDVRPFVAMTNWLRDHRFSAPRIDAQDLEQGFLLLEDLGDELYRDVCAEAPDSEKALYSAAIDLLAEMTRLPLPERLPFSDEGWPLAPYDAPVLHSEARLVTDWYRPGVLGTKTPPDLAAEFESLLLEAIAPLASTRDVVVLRDYHAENLLWLPERQGTARVGLLDYQDALAGHPAYDLVSLLEDARRDTSEALQEAMIARFIARTGLASDPFLQAYAALGAQRNLKIIGIFARLAVRDGKARYPDLIPRVWRHLQRDLAHPALAELRDWVARHLPEPDADALARLRQAAGLEAAE
ncbi:MAG: phosphotransferase [Pseudomonadota bacterium]